MSPSPAVRTIVDPINIYGFTPVPSSPSSLISCSHPPPTRITTLSIPSTPLATRINTYAKSHLPPETYNHSLRVYHYGLAIRNHFPWSLTDETFFLACLLHDIGTGENLTKTRMSFEFYGGFIAMDVLRHGEGVGDAVAPVEQAESIVEAIIRHQDLCEKGKITALGQLLQLATIFDNTGSHASLVHPDTIVKVTAEYPRNKWSGCFAGTIRRENELKPWAHTTTLGEEELPAKVLGNTLMEPYE